MDHNNHPFNNPRSATVWLLWEGNYTITDGR